MENPLDFKLRVELEVDAKIGDNWYDCKWYWIWQNNKHKNNNMTILYWVLLSIIAVIAAFLIYYYSDPKAALYTKILVFSSFTLSLICFVILPIDIYESSLESS